MESARHTLNGSRGFEVFGGFGFSGFSGLNFLECSKTVKRGDSSDLSEFTALAQKQNAFRDRSIALMSQFVQFTRESPESEGFVFDELQIFEDLFLFFFFILRCCL